MRVPPPRHADSPRHRATRRAVAALVAAACFVISTAVAAAAPSLQQRWLLMVRTLNKDPERSREFNDWYDKIDIPDVLAVPGFRRAQRGQSVGSCMAATPCCPDVDERYVALYDIESRAIDKTIIDMLMATWKMLRAGRDTPLLEVEERVYYRRMHAPLDINSGNAKGGARYLLLERFDTLEGGNDRLIAAQARHLETRTGPLRVERYELYRVLMFEPRQAPRYLTVYSFAAASEEAAEEARHALVDFAERQHAAGYRHAESLLYRELADVTAEDLRHGQGYP